MAVSNPDHRPSRTRLALLLITGAFALMGLAGYWGFTQVKKLIDAMDCQPNIAVAATGTTVKGAETAALAAWEQKASAAYGVELATSGLKSNTSLSCSGSGSTHTCAYAAQACVWKK